MLPLVDIHCHLCAGLDDGPRTLDDALAMCRSAQAQGVRLMAATAHQNDRWCDVTPERIRSAARGLQSALQEHNISVTVLPCAEVTARPDLADAWRRGELLSMSDRRQYLLVEMPHGVYVDLRSQVAALRRAGVRTILAHPEREPELLHTPGLLEDLVEAGCLAQVSSASVVKPRKPQDRRALKAWCERGLVHLLGSDGHSPERRPPMLAPAYQELGRWIGFAAADRIAGTNGLAVLHGLPLTVPRPRSAQTARLVLSKVVAGGSLNGTTDNVPDHPRDCA